MAKYSELLLQLIDSIKKVQQEKFVFYELYSNQSIQHDKNEYLFFIKPEITLESTAIKLEAILRLVFDKIDLFNFKIHNINIISAKYLKEYDIIAQHYGVINKISLNARMNLSEIARNRFFEFYCKEINEVKILGGHEFISSYPNFDAYSLNTLWDNLENIKLASGTYCEKIRINNEDVYVLNGFHPNQLEHYISKGRSIVTMTLSSNTSWSKARNYFVGDTNPSKAQFGSLRREFLENKTNLGLNDVSQGKNCVHLSAGPVEALIELVRYNSNLSIVNGLKDYSDYQFGKILLDNFNSSFKRIINNLNIKVSNRDISIFDLTEEKDSEEAISILKLHIK